MGWSSTYRTDDWGCLPTKTLCSGACYTVLRYPVRFVIRSNGDWITGWDLNYYTIDGRIPALVDMVNIPLFAGFYTSQVVIAWFLNHQQFDSLAIVVHVSDSWIQGTSQYYTRCSPYTSYFHGSFFPPINGTIIDKNLGLQPYQLLGVISPQLPNWKGQEPLRGMVWWFQVLGKNSGKNTHKELEWLINFLLKAKVLGDSPTFFF